MKYQNSKPVHQEARKEVNNITLQAIESNSITPQEAFNSFSGMGKLHGLEFNQFGSFHEYTDAKKAIENGAFFTPFEIAEKITEVLQPTGTILDPCCGAGIFANFIEEIDFTGIEIDPNTYEVANFCFPDANIIRMPIQNWNSKGKKFDYILTNPPFNLRWGKLTSQHFILKSSKNWLKNYGIFAAVVPETYLQDEMYYKKDREFLNKNFHWIGQIELGKEAFKNDYDILFPTKVIFFQNCKGDNYSNSFLSWFELEKKIETINQTRKENKISIAQSEVNENDYSFSDNQRDTKEGFNFQVRKYLYEIKTHKKGILKAYDLLRRLKEQVKPEFTEQKEWERIALTEEKVINRLKSYIGYTKRSKKGRKIAPTDKTQITPLAEIQPSEEINNFLQSFTFIDSKGTFNLTDIQKSDVSKLLSKKYSILNSEQGTGKTPQAFAVCEHRKSKLNIILAPALAIDSTWQEHLQLNNKSFKVIKKDSDINFNVDYWLISYTTLAIKPRLAKALRKQLRRISNNCQLIVDESDELSNFSSKSYKAARTALSKCRYKLLTTGTTTRNNITELYPQLEFLYCNSNNLINYCEKVYKENDSLIAAYPNDNKGNPFKDSNEFAQSFNPAKTTVFGIQKQDQDLYNYDELTKILNYTSIVRTFKEVVGDKYKIHHKRIESTLQEKFLYELIAKESYKIIYEHFNHTGNQRKESFLRILRELTLLIKACSMPQSFSQYNGKGSSKQSYIFDMLKKRKEKTIVGCLSKNAVKKYKSLLGKLGRPLFVVTGNVSFKRRKEIIKEFENTSDGIIVCTQQSLKSSVNIPTCNLVIVESLHWNWPKMSQFFFRAIRFNSEHNTDVYFITIENTIEDNLLGLILAKEKVNRSVKLDNKSNTEIFEEYGFDINILDMVMRKEYDKENKRMSLVWGKQTFFKAGEQTVINF